MTNVDFRGRPKARRGFARLHHNVDEIAVERAVGGDPIPLGVVERQLAVEALTRRGRSINQIADQLGISHETVTRCRAKAHSNAAVT